MQAATYQIYGPAETVTLREVPVPEIGEQDILIQVHAAAVTTADWRIRASAFPGFAWLPGRLMFGLFRPRNQVLGSDFAGVVARAGSGVTRFRPGDAVFGFADAGSHAEAVKLPQDGVVAAMPDGLDWAHAAAVPFGALSALVFLRDFARLKPGQRVLVNGASGGVGVYLVQITKHLGAEVTGVASGANLDLVASLGADRVIDYTAEDFTASGERYDLIVDTVGKTSFRSVRRALTPDGIYLPLEFGFGDMMWSLWTRMTGGPRVVVGVSADRREDLEILRSLLEAGKIRPVIDQVYPLDRIVAAYKRVESRHKTGAVVVTMPAADRTAA